MIYQNMIIKNMIHDKILIVRLKISKKVVVSKPKNIDSVVLHECSINLFFFD